MTDTTKNSADASVASSSTVGAFQEPDQNTGNGITTSDSMDKSAVLVGQPIPAASDAKATAYDNVGAFPASEPQTIGAYDAVSGRRNTINYYASNLAKGVAAGPRGTDDPMTIASRARQIAECLIELEEGAERAAKRVAATT
jgi:hypothetical protein